MCTVRVACWSERLCISLKVGFGSVYYLVPWGEKKDYLCEGLYEALREPQFNMLISFPGDSPDASGTCQ